MGYFFFGTLRDREVLELVLGRKVADDEIEPATLRGYRLAVVEDESYPVVVPAPASRVNGVLARRLSERDRARLTWFECDEYRPETARVELKDGSRVDAILFLPREEVDGTQEDWDCARWQREEKAVFMKLTREWMALEGSISLDEATARWEARRDGMKPPAGPLPRARAG